MNYNKLMKIACDLEKSLGSEIEERVEEEKAITPIPEPSLEACVTDKEVNAYLASLENEVQEEANLKAAKKLTKIAQKIMNKKTPLTASQKQQLKASLQKISNEMNIEGAAEEENTELNRQDVTRELNRRFNKDGKLLVKIDWKKTGHLTPNIKLREMTLDDLRLLLTCVRG